MKKFVLLLSLSAISLRVDHERLIQLSDGSHIYLKNNTSVTFSLEFDPNEQYRFVEMWGYGAIFKVAPHKVPFAVHVVDQNRVIVTTNAYFYVRGKADVLVLEGQISIQPFSASPPEKEKIAQLN